MTTEDLYRSEHLLARFRIPAEHTRGQEIPETLVVTFGSYSDQKTLDREGFGEGFFHHYGVPAIHVISKENAWYQHEEMAELLQAVKARSSQFRHVFTYGSSMGAYAALRHARFLEATAIAMGPQYSIDPAVMPTEERWQEAVGLSFMTEGRQRLEQPRKAYLFFDPRLPEDCRHIRRIRRDIVATPVPLPYGGHIVANHLSCTGQLSTSIRQIIANNFSPERCTRTVWARRIQSSVFFETRAETLFQRAPLRALTCARKAYQLQPQSGAAAYNLARILIKVGDLRNALKLAQKAVELEPHSSLYRRYLAFALLKNKNYSGCSAQLEHLLAEDPTQASTHHLLAKYYLHTGEMEKAIQSEKQAVTLHPTRALYKRTWLLYRLRQKLQQWIPGLWTST